MYLYFHIVICLIICFCKYYNNIILQKLFAYCDELQENKADRTEVDVVSLYS